jgi:hypothetical protein
MLDVLIINTGKYQNTFITGDLITMLDVLIINTGKYQNTFITGVIFTRVYDEDI